MTNLNTLLSHQKGMLIRPLLGRLRHSFRVVDLGSSHRILMPYNVQLQPEKYCHEIDLKHIDRDNKDPRHLGGDMDTYPDDFYISHLGEFIRSNYVNYIKFFVLVELDYDGRLTN